MIGQSINYCGALVENLQSVFFNTSLIYPLTIWFILIQYYKGFLQSLLDHTKHS